VDLQAFRVLDENAASACHAEGRGFESHQPLSERPAFAGLFREWPSFDLLPERQRRVMNWSKFGRRHLSVAETGGFAGKQREVELTTFCVDAKGRRFGAAIGRLPACAAVAQKNARSTERWSAAGQAYFVARSA